MLTDDAPRMRPNILITGTPGTGKTTTSEQVAEACPGVLRHVNVSELVQAEGLHEGYDEERKSYIIDEERVCDELEDSMAAGGVVLDTHSLVDFLPERWFDLVVVLRTDNTVLFDRLRKRGYNESKVTENVECEIMQVILEEARQSYKPEILQELRSDTVEELEENVSRIVSWVAAFQANASTSSAS